MFDDRTKPLYKLCDRIMLGRIEQKDSIPFIKNKFKKKFGNYISDELIEIILNTAKNHPYYVNVLCHRIFRSDDKISEKLIESVWHQYALEEKSHIRGELDLLSTNQQRMLISIAKMDNVHLTGKEFISQTGFSLSSASQAIKNLEKMDYISQDDTGKYFVIDPLIEYVFGKM